MDGKSLSVTKLLDFARGLRSEHGENPEYDRALVELCCDAAGWPMDRKVDMARELGIVK
jgi:hypothetical protein